MRAIKLEAHEVRVVEVPDPKVSPGFVLLRTRASGICGSDLHVYRGKWQVKRTHPVGHEFCGDVVAVGAGVENALLGQRVCVECFSHCGTCRYCQTSQYNHCTRRRFLFMDGPGGFAPMALVHASALVPLPPVLSDEDGAFVEPLAVGLRALAQTEARAPDRLAIVGAGTIGLCTAAVAVAAGFSSVWMSCRHPHQVEAAQRLGVPRPVLSAGPEGPTMFWQAVEAETDGQGVDTVVDTIGTAAAFEDAVKVVRPGGRLSLVGGYTGPVTVPLGQVVSKELQVFGSQCYACSNGRRDFEAAIELLASSRVLSEVFVTHRFPSFEEAPQAFRIADDKCSGSIKVQFVLA